MDVAIVGGGPAGAWTARGLARRGARVTLFDPSHPREKPCGGGVTGRALALVNDAIDAAAVGAVPVEHARFAHLVANGTAPPAVTVPLASRPASNGLTPLVVVSRAIFDRALLDAAVRAGARHVSERVRAVRVDRTGAFLQTGSTWLRADFLVGADGANSLVRRRLSRAFARSELSIAGGFFVHGTTSATIDIAFSGRPAGYLWSFPRRDHLAVGACGQADACSTDRVRSLTLDWLRRAGLAAETRLERYAWPIPSLPATFRQDAPLAGPRWLLVGDAAGLVDPITREGIFFAIRSGELAAAAVAGDGEPAARYVAELEGEVVAELERAARLRTGFFERGFLQLAMQGLARSPRLRAVMADLVSGEQPYRTLRRRLLATWEVGLALQLLAHRLRKAGHQSSSDSD